MWGPCAARALPGSQRRVRRERRVWSETESVLAETRRRGDSDTESDTESDKEGQGKVGRDRLMDHRHAPASEHNHHQPNQ